MFDNSLDGKNVRAKTQVLEKMVKSVIKEQPPLVRFQWGDLLFRGTMQSVTETIDLFSEDGVPLRSTVSLSLTGNREEQRGAAAGAGSGAGAGAGLGLGLSLSAGASIGASAGVSASLGFSASMGASAGLSVGTSPLTLSQSGDTLQGLAAKAGVDWKTAASANNIDNPRQVQPGTIIDLKAGLSVKR